MSKEDVIEIEGIVREAMPNAIYKWLWKPDTSSADRDFLPVLRILCRRR